MRISLVFVLCALTVSPGVAVGMANPLVQQRAIDFANGFFDPGSPQNIIQFVGAKVLISPTQRLKSVAYDFRGQHEIIGIAMITFGVICIYSAIRKKK